MYQKSERSIFKLGMILSLVLGILYFFVTFFIAIDPVGMFFEGEGSTTFASTPYINCIWRSLFALICILDIGFFSALTLFFKKNNEDFEGPIRWLSTLVTAAMVVGALNWMNFVKQVEVIFGAHNRGVTIETIYLPIDSYFIWTWGFFGAYLIFMNYLGIRNRSISKKMGWLGTAIGIISILMIVFYANHKFIDIYGYKLNIIIICGALLGGILGPIYHFSFVKYLKRELNSNNEINVSKAQLSPTNN